jgi:hypothetical protein
MIRKILILSMFICLLSCNKSLTRDDAEKAIKKKENLPKDELEQFNSTEGAGEAVYYHYLQENRDEFERNTIKPKSDFFKTLENEGLITISKSTDRYRADHDEYGRFIIYGESYYYHAFFTDKAKPYIIGNQVKLATIEFGEITGIVERKELNIAEVNYTSKRKNITPFGMAHNLKEATFSFTVTFTKYDDGWRINN